jgi:hypothetical protein
MPMDNNTKTSSKDKVNAIWSRDDKSILIRTLKRAKEDSKWGDNNPKEAAWTACVAALLDSEKISKLSKEDGNVYMLMRSSLVLKACFCVFP